MNSELPSNGHFSHQNASEGDEATIRLSTRGVASGTNYFWRISGADADQGDTDLGINGVMTVDDFGIAKAQFTFSEDGVPDGTADRPDLAPAGARWEVFNIEVFADEEYTQPITNFLGTTTVNVQDKSFEVKPQLAIGGFNLETQELTLILLTAMNSVRRCPLGHTQAANPTSSQTVSRSKPKRTAYNDRQCHFQHFHIE